MMLKSGIESFQIHIVNQLEGGYYQFIDRFKSEGELSRMKRDGHSVWLFEGKTAKVIVTDITGELTKDEALKIAENRVKRNYWSYDFQSEQWTNRPTYPFSHNRLKAE